MPPASDQDTIAAIATPPGRGGIGILRLSGPTAIAIAHTLIDPETPQLQPRHATFTRLLDRDSRILDEAIATYYPAPHSYTSEEVVEIAAHGSPVLLDHLLRAAIAAGARLAEPGEFTQRAFLSGRLDLTQAEAVHDLIAAQTLAQAQLAARQLGGSLSHQIAPAKHQLLALIAALEAGMDFAAEDSPDELDRLPTAAILDQIGAVTTPLQTLERTYGYATVLREGFTIALAGLPNAGKSSLFNALIERPRAIVTAEAGTTRDPIAETLTLSGIPIRLVDTAGLRPQPSDIKTVILNEGKDPCSSPSPLANPGITPTLSEAETLGIAKSHEAIAEADLILHILDVTSIDFTYPGAELTRDPALAATLAARPHLTVLNKLDLLPSRLYSQGATLGQQGSPPILLTSARTGQGIAELRAAILAAVHAHPPEGAQALVTNLRQHTAVAAALGSLQAAAEAIRRRLPHELLLVDLHAALSHLDELTGITTSDDLLRLIFSTFCIGK